MTEATNMGDGIELLPCPFCGGEADIENTITEVVVRCHVCRARVLRHHAPNSDKPGIDAAIAAWNARTARQPADDVVERMTQRFLGWRLPDDFAPDAGISFQPEFNVEYNAKQGLPPQRHQPTGTNLFDYEQAKAMVEYMLEGAAPAPDHRGGQANE